MKDELVEPTCLHKCQEYIHTFSIKKAGTGTSGRHSLEECQADCSPFLTCPSFILPHPPYSLAQVRPTFSASQPLLPMVLPIGRHSLLKPTDREEGSKRSDTVRVSPGWPLPSYGNLHRTDNLPEHQIPRWSVHPKTAGSFT